jgi:hypothetical protein
MEDNKWESELEMYKPKESEILVRIGIPEIIGFFIGIIGSLYILDFIGIF